MILNRHSIAMVFIFLTAVPVSSAQAPVLRQPVESAFLVELADRLAARGEYAEANDILLKMQKSEPDNPAVQNLLARIQGRVETKQSIGSSDRQIASDIEMIQGNILRNERRNRDLEFLIRNLVQENDVLSQTLARRNRHLLDLMKKVYGDGATLPEITVAGDAQKAQRILSGYQDQIVERDRQLVASNAELSRIVRQIDQVNDSIKDDGGIDSPREQTPIKDAQELSQNFKDKRDSLVDKSLVVLDKSRDLQLLQSEMMKLSATLKQADDKYASAIKEYDGRIQTIKDSWASDKTRQQNEIDGLKKELSVKSKDFDDLQKSIAAQSPVLEERKKDLALKDEAIARVDGTILEKDQEIVRLEGLIAQKDGEIAVQKKKIDEQGLTLQFADDKTADLTKRVVRIRQSLSDGDRALEELKTLVVQLKKRAQTSPEDPAAAARLADWKAQLQGALQALDEKQKNILQLKSKLDEYQAQAGQKDTLLARQQEMLDDLETELKKARANEASLKERLETSRQKMEMVVETLGTYKENASASSQRADDLSAKVYDLEDRLERAVIEANQETRFLKQTLLQKDKDLTALQQELLTKEDRLKYFYRAMQDATKALNANMLSHGQEPTPPSWPSDGGIRIPSSDDNPWDPKHNDIYALQQRLATTVKELHMARGQFAAQEARLKDLQSQLSAKEQEARVRKEEYNQVLLADNARLESKKSTEREVALHIAQLERDAGQARKDLSRVRQEFDDYKNSVDKNADDSRLKDQRIKFLEKKIEQAKKELDEDRAKMKESDAQIVLLREAIDHETKKFDTLKKQLKEANTLIGVSESTFGNRDLSIQDLQSNLDHAKIRERDYKRQIGDVEGQLRESYAMVRQGEARMADLRDQLAAKESRLAALRDEVARLKDRLRRENKTVADGPELVTTPSEKR